MSTPNRQRGLLRLETNLQSEAHVADDARIFQLPSSGLQEAGQQVAGAFGAIAAKVGALADHAASVEGREAGRLAGLDPEFRPSRAMTIRGEAFDRAGLETHVTQVRLAIQSELAEVEQQYGQNPAALDQAIRQRRTAWLQNSLPEVQPDVAALFGREHLTMMRTATRLQLERRHHEAAGAVHEDLAQTLRRIHQRAYSLGLDATADDVLAADMGQINGLLARRGPDGRPLISPEQAARLRIHAAEEVSIARIRGAFDRMPSIDAREAFLRQFREDYGNGQGLAGAFDIQGFRRIENEMEAEIRRLRTGDGAALRELTGQISQVLQHAARGFRMPAEDLAALRARITQSADPALIASLEQAEGIVQFVQGMQQRSPLEIDAWLRQERARLRLAATPAERERLVQMEALSREMHTQLAADPLGWAARVGLVQLAPLDLGGDNAAAAMRRRVAQAGELTQLYGVAVNPLRPDEVRALSARLAEGGDTFLATSAMIANAAGPNAPAIWRQLYQQGSNGAAVLGALALSADPRNPSTFLRDAADGMALMRTRGDNHRPAPGTNNERRDAAVGAIGDALGGTAPQNLDGVMAVANWAYEIYAARNQITAFDRTAYRSLVLQALGQQSIGGRTYGGIAYPQAGYIFNGSGVVIPQFVRQDTFRELVDNITPEHLGDMPLMRPGGPSADLARIRGARWITVGVGQYMLSTGTENGRPQLLQSPAGGDYVLDLNVVGRRMRADPRFRHLFLGGAP